jgi:predicted nucleotidyltransferase
VGRVVLIRLLVPGGFAVSTLQRLTDRGLVKPPRWLPTSVQYETIMGSVAYGVSSDTSDMDVYGWAIPPKEDVFPHLGGEISGFGRQRKRFEQFQEHHIKDPDALSGRGRDYDLTIFGIVKFFQLAMENNPNVIDSLFTPATCVLHGTRVGNLVRENRRLFLHRGAWPKFKGYAYSQLHKLSSKEPKGKRAELVAAHGFDTKYAYHVVRLLGEAEQILVEGDIDLQRDNDRLKAIRRGEWTEDRLRQWAADKEADLERAYAASQLTAVPDEDKLRGLLLNCLEEHYGSLSGCVTEPDRAVAALRAVQAELDRVRDLM